MNSHSWMHNLLSDLITNYVTRSFIGRINKYQSLRSYPKVCSRVKSKITLSDLIGNIVKNSDCEMVDVMALIGGLITIFEFLTPEPTLFFRITSKSGFSTPKP